MDRIPERWWYALSGVIVVVAVVIGWQLLADRDDSDGTTGLNDPPASSSPASTSSTEPSASPTPDRDAWREKFTDEQLREFDSALRDWERFGELMAPYYREPGDPDEVRSIFERYTYNPTGYTDNYIANYVQGGTRVLTSTTPLYVTGRKIEVNKKGSLVEFDQCTDYRNVDMRRKGERLPAGPKNETAILRVQMSYYSGSAAEPGWRVLTSKVVDKPCE